MRASARHLRRACGRLAASFALCGAGPLVVAQDCADALVRMQRINVGSGVYTEQAVAAAPLEIDIPIALDPQRYGACLEREGLDRSGAVAAWVERSADCRRDSVARVHLGPPGSAPRISSAADEERYRACVESTLEVEVELPQ